MNTTLVQLIYCFLACRCSNTCTSSTESSRKYLATVIDSVLCCFMKQTCILGEDLCCKSCFYINVMQDVVDCDIWNSWDIPQECQHPPIRFTVHLRMGRNLESHSPSITLWQDFCPEKLRPESVPRRHLMKLGQCRLYKKAGVLGNSCAIWLISSCRHGFEALANTGLALRL